MGSPSGDSSSKRQHYRGHGQQIVEVRERHSGSWPTAFLPFFFWTFFFFFCFFFYSRASRSRTSRAWLNTHCTARFFDHACAHLDRHTVPRCDLIISIGSLASAATSASADTARIPVIGQNRARRTHVRAAACRSRSTLPPCGSIAWKCRDIAVRKAHRTRCRTGRGAASQNSLSTRIIRSRLGAAIAPPQPKRKEENKTVSRPSADNAVDGAHIRVSRECAQSAVWLEHAEARHRAPQAQARRRSGCSAFGSAKSAWQPGGEKMNANCPICARSRERLESAQPMGPSEPDSCCRPREARLPYDCVTGLRAKDSKN